MNGNEITQTSEKMAQETAEALTFSSVFSVKDLKSSNFGALLVCDNDSEAIRCLKIRLMYDRDSLMTKFPADFMLYHVGYFNTKTGVMKSTEIAIPVISVLDVSAELEKELKARQPDIPEFMQKGEKNECTGKEQCVSDCPEDCGQTA